MIGANGNGVAEESPAATASTPRPKQVVGILKKKALALPRKGQRPGGLATPRHFPARRAGTVSAFQAESM